MKLAGFGDSITAGQYLKPGESFLELLGERFGLETIQAGVPGNTTTQGLARMEQDVLAFQPDLCIVEFGMNDHVAESENNAKTPLPQFKQNLERICSSLKQAGIRPVLCTINPIIEGDAEAYYYARHPRDWYKEPDGAAAWIDLYSEAIREIAGRNRIPLADIALDWKTSLAQGRKLNELLRSQEFDGIDDGVHPSPTGQALYARCIADAMIRAGYLE